MNITKDSPLVVEYDDFYAMYNLVANCDVTIMLDKKIYIDGGIQIRGNLISNVDVSTNDVTIFGNVTAKELQGNNIGILGELVLSDSFFAKGESTIGEMKVGGVAVLSGKSIILSSIQAEKVLFNSLSIVNGSVFAEEIIIKDVVDIKNTIYSNMVEARGEKIKEYARVVHEEYIYLKIGDNVYKIKDNSIDEVKEDCDINFLNALVQLESIKGPEFSDTEECH
jgi:hypothetical protein